MEEEINEAVMAQVETRIEVLEKSASNKKKPKALSDKINNLIRTSSIVIKQNGMMKI